MAEFKIQRYLGDLFPSQWSAFIFVSYMVLFINQGILVTLTKTSDNKYNYNTVVVVLLTECIKLLIAIAIFAKDNPLRALFSQLISHRKVLISYLVPASLYCLYNNLAYVNLANYDPTTYYLLLQLRVVCTGIVYQLLFKKKLSSIQWFSLVLLTLGCLVKQMGGFKFNSSSPSSIINFNLLLIFIQVFCSCFAGVYNEYLLKYKSGSTGSGSKTQEVDIMVQNIYMYVDSIVCNLVILTLTGQLSQLWHLSSESSLILRDPKIISVMVNNAWCGIVTSVFLKNLNSILKTFASALELLFTAILCWIIFAIAIDFYTVIAIAIVSYATYIYSQNPVKNVSMPSSESKEDSHSQIKYAPISNQTQHEEDSNENHDSNSFTNNMKRGRIEHV